MSQRKVNRERFLPSPEEAARIDALVGGQPGHEDEVAWSDPGPDPFGQGWEWMNGPESENLPDIESGFPGEDANTQARPDVLPFTPNRRAKPDRRKLLVAGCAAASLLIGAAGWWMLAGRWGGPIVERDVAAWVAQRLESDAGKVRIAAPADDERSDSPLITTFDRPRDASGPSTPNVYAPLRIQEQLAVPEVTPSGAATLDASRPVRSVREVAGPGDLFYLEFTTASAPSPGSAVVVSLRANAWRLLRDEVGVSPSEGTDYFGPVKMGDVEATYFVILADRTKTPLLLTVSGVIPKDGGEAVSPESFRDRIASALASAGHAWYGIQRIEVKPERQQQATPKPTQ